MSRGPPSKRSSCERAVSITRDGAPRVGSGVRSGVVARLSRSAVRSVVCGGRKPGDPGIQAYKSESHGERLAGACRTSPFARVDANRIAASAQFTDDVEGYVFDGADGSQVALWTAHADRVSTEHTHDFDEYILVIEGRCTLILGETRTELRAGQELVIPRGTRQSMEVAAGTRTMHVFGGKRGSRAGEV
jgi:quercetin dioxygenase-like cupin family protein